MSCLLLQRIYSHKDIGWLSWWFRPISSILRIGNGVAGNLKELCLVTKERIKDGAIGMFNKHEERPIGQPKQFRAQSTRLPPAHCIGLIKSIKTGLQWFVPPAKDKPPDPCSADTYNVEQRVKQNSSLKLDTVEPKGTIDEYDLGRPPDYKVNALKNDTGMLSLNVEEIKIAQENHSPVGENVQGCNEVGQEVLNSFVEAVREGRIICKDAPHGVLYVICVFCRAYSFIRQVRRNPRDEDWHRPDCSLRRNHERRGGNDQPAMDMRPERGRQRACTCPENIQRAARDQVACNMPRNYSSPPLPVERSVHHVPPSRRKSTSGGIGPIRYIRAQARRPRVCSNCGPGVPDVRECAECGVEIRTRTIEICLDCGGFVCCLDECQTHRCGQRGTRGRRNMG